MEVPAQRPTSVPVSYWLMLAAALAVPLSLLWDYAWEFTVGIDLVWSAPHVANYVTMAVAALGALVAITAATRGGAPAVSLGKWRAPLGVWVVLWGAVAYLLATLYDRWWQTGYGQGAGIWHPPQLLKAVSFFAATTGVWMFMAGRQGGRGAWGFALAGGAVLAMIGVVTLPSTLANRQHGAAFYQIACGAYPLVLVAAAVAGRWRFSATAAALGYTLIDASMVWVMPLVHGEPLAGPIYHHREHLLPPPFPLLLVAPAFAFDLLLRVFPGKGAGRGKAVETGLAFFFVFTATQWVFASFLLSSAADHWFFAGGGKEWPFFQPIPPALRTAFWPVPGDELNGGNAGWALGLAILSSVAGLWLGGWMKRLRP